MLPKIVKILVFANLAVSVGLLAGALSGYFSRQDLVQKDPNATQRTEDAYADDTNNLERLQWKIEELSKGVKAAQAGYARAAGAATDTELVRDYRADRFALRTGEARNGAFKTFVMLPKPNSAWIDVNQAGEPILGVDKKPVRGLDSVQQDLDNAIRDSGQFLMQSTQRRNEYKALLTEIDGLYTRISKQKDILVQLKDEFEYLSDRRTDWDEQVRTLKKRTEQVTAAKTRLDGK